MNANNSNGFSLLELMVSTAIVAVSILVLMSLSISGANYTLGVKERIEAKDQSLKAEYILRLMFGSAILVEAGAANGGLDLAGNEALASPVGHIIADSNFNRLNPLGAGGAVTPIATFLREQSTTSYSDIRRTGIWYKSPTPNGAVPSTSGILFIDTDVKDQAVALNPFNNAPPAGTGYDNLFIDRLTEFQISKLSQVNNIGRPKVREVIFRLVFRYFGQPMTATKTWCPAADIQAVVAGCGVGQFNDLTHSFRVTLKNNDLSDSTADFQGLGAGTNDAIQRPLGPIHFFRLVAPRARYNF